MSDINLLPMVIKFVGPRGPREYAGFLVPETAGVFAIDERYKPDESGAEESEWAVTHLPSGTRADRFQNRVRTAEHAAEFAQRLFREMLALGCDLNSTDHEAARGPVAALSDEERRAFWERVQP